MEWLQIIITLLLFMIIVVPVGKYLYYVSTGHKIIGDKLFDKIDNFIYKICGISKDDEMDWKEYIFSIIAVNAAMVFIGYIMLRAQGFLFFNPNKINGMEQSLSFNTIISFMTNTNLQDYSGESGLSNFSQMIVIIFMMFTSAATGFSAAIAFIRGIIGRKLIGNFFVDMTRVTTRVLLPLSIIVGILLVSQGVPQTLSGTKTVTTIEGKMQDIAIGPVAALESIKHIGTNGGGFFGANSAHPFENPTPISNLIEILSMMILPGALVYTFGLMLRNKKQGWTIFGAMAGIFIIALPICYYAEKAGNPALAHVGLNQLMGNMEGKEVRFGVGQSALFATVTTSFTTGTVNNMHDSLTPIGGAIALMNMMLNVVFGGKGVGFMNMMMYAILTVFLCGLMVGRTPEFLSKKIEGKEIKLIALAIIIHPLLILMSSALALISPEGIAGISNSGFHGLTQIVYQFTSSAANNGSGFEGLGDNTLFWNTATGIVMFYGRYLSIIILLSVAGSLAAKRTIPTTIGTFRTDNTMFALTLIAIVLIIGALTFLPALALGPIAEHLTLWN
ncbi:potassium-transporting ATPase potassium-binding subunit [Clostridium beijerinckii]|uniref:Potassium-transporting ATPase potassium-binding subunit n=2 Tax=Clostridium beijerinckii TaxID=1520 RepID=A0AAE5EXW9_CLOBE|nr:potassium-transporting ATPase subunit KdpA [Clostridium beijerinckii]ALB47251.1 potassium-transporting ATPase subunit KdpA [Clostridium beijerinckii NRRL B-598]MCI1477436.1 potassium-transporting ATPase subunit KdpA [Clostridium beijerinckii]MCI1577213.1 potassium-transporting ATPase subunit KdpA [Clostridium beijerinckii]MCI1582695.1 potassium-transporting ATPase subunit KdpA [Clostridium beijerinckii]MCI1624003.1 potassium-transporting ATPase subunit KdpA [Clostridium beijerinckii]